MAVTHYDPWRTLSRFQDDVNRLFEGQWPRLSTEENVATSDWMPAVDIKEDADRFILLADLPGVEAKDIDIHMENGMLTLRGERESERKDEREGYKRTERMYGVFYRRFSLPETADPERISARSKNGVLEIVIPKKEAVQPRRITVEG